MPGVREFDVNKSDLKKSIVVALLLALASGEESSVAGAEEALPPRQAFIAELQRAVRGHDVAWLSAHLRYPLRYHTACKSLIRTKSWFVKNYPSIFDAKLRAAVLAQTPDRVFENWQGIMVGEGSRNIWIRDVANGPPPRYQIITINNTH